MARRKQDPGPYASLELLGRLLEEAKRVADTEDYQITYQLEYRFDLDMAALVRNKLEEYELGDAEIIPDELGDRGSVELYAEGLPGLINIIRFDRFLTEAKMISALANLQIAELEWNQKHPTLNRFLRSVGLRRDTPLPTITEVEAEVDFMYTKAGINFR